MPRRRVVRHSSAVLNPKHLVVPLASVSEDGLVHRYLGTAFFVAPGMVMTARHVLDVALPDGLAIAAGLAESPRISPHHVTVAYLDQEHDIAIGGVDNWPLDDHLSITGDDEYTINRMVMTMEYSASERTDASGDGDDVVRSVASVHIGHVVRSYVRGFGQMNPAHGFDVSYPAFAGASGAPVMDYEELFVVGMILGNVERHLIPAFMERIEGPDNAVVEDRRYFLPQGYAIAARHLRDALAALRASGA